MRFWRLSGCGDCDGGTMRKVIHNFEGSTRENHRRIDKAVSGCIEPLERRMLLTTVPVSFFVSDFLQLRDPDPVGDGDYYLKVKVGDNPEQSTEFEEGNPISGGSFQPGWN